MLHGHFWTIRRHLGDTIERPRYPASRWFRLDIDDVDRGTISLSGRLSEVPESDELLIVVHGLGGCADSVYMRRTAARAAEAGLSCLRLNLRGADRRGEDFFHAGLSQDLHAVLAAPALARYTRRYLLGFSLGGHIVLRTLAEATEPKASLVLPSPSQGSTPSILAAAAICAPLHLEASATALDALPYWPYRYHVLRGLFEMYERCHARGIPLPLPATRAARIRSIRAWDDAIVAPRFGYSSASEYYARNSAAYTLDRITTPTLLVQARRDPMVPRETVAPWWKYFPAAISAVEVDRGGHVGFPSDLDLGQLAPLGLEPQLFSWLRQVRIP